MRGALVPLALCAMVGCSAPQEAAPPAAAEETPEPVPQEAGTAPACSGAPWAAETEADVPPAGYLACESDGGCASHRVEGCCESFLVAVARPFEHCIAGRNSRASCRAHCALPRPGEVPALPTAACVEGSCRLVAEDGTPRQVFRMPFEG